MTSDAHSIGSLEELCGRVKNWGTWGPDDMLGTLNYITPEKIVEAAGLVRSGSVFQLGVPLDRRDGPQATARRRYNPIHFMDQLPTDAVLAGEVGIADDVLVLPLQSSTQWDSLAHVAYKGRLYGGRPASLVTSDGALVNSIRSVSGKVISRGVLVDVAHYKGVDALPSGFAIGVADLVGTLQAQDVHIGRGDVLLVRTGHLGKCRPLGWQGFHNDAPGLGLETVDWIYEHQLAAVASDTSNLEVKPFAIDGVAAPFHVAALTHMGLLLGEIFDLDALATDCHNDRRFAFLFVAPPMPVTGGVGSYVNPYAVK